MLSWLFSDPLALVSKVPATSHISFRSKYNPAFPLFADEGQRTNDAYRAGGLFVKRTVRLIGPGGVIASPKQSGPAVTEAPMGLR